MVTASTQLLRASTSSHRERERRPDHPRRAAYEYEAASVGSRYWRWTPAAPTNKTQSYLLYDNRTGRDYQSAARCRLSIKFGSGVIGPHRAGQHRSSAEQLAKRFPAGAERLALARSSVRTLSDKLELFMTTARATAHRPTVRSLVNQPGGARRSRSRHS